MKKNFISFQRGYFQHHPLFLACGLMILVVNIPFSSGLSLPAFRVQGSEGFQIVSEDAGWELMESGVTQDINSVFFICLNRGSVAGDQGLILQTGDGGDNWTAQNSGVTDNLYDIYYFGYSILLAVGTSGTILFTNNTGQNWSIIQTGMMASYYSGQMISDTIGVAVGVNAIFQPFFTRTDDGWNTWESTSFYIENENVFYEGRLTDVYFLNSSVGFATAIVDVPTGGAIVRTTDGGITWETVLFYNEPLYSIDFTWDGVGYAVGEHGKILQSTDEGDTWVELDSGTETALHAVDFSSETTGCAVGDTGMILRTDDGGITWVQQSSGTTVDLYDVMFITQQTGFVVGEAGIILGTQTGGYPPDTTPPQTTCTLSGTMQGEVFVSDVTVILNATDDFSGVATTQYKLDDGLWMTYEDAPVLVTENGDHLLGFYSIDNAGNIEEEQSVAFTIEHPPDLTITVSGGFGYTVTIENHDPVQVTNATWDFTLEGGIILFGQHRSGSVTIQAEGTQTVKAFVCGFGKPMVTFSIASFQQTWESRLFFIFTRL
jgi:photosystem II stability/assembly factor-like uncharacterized protein